MKKVLFFACALFAGMAVTSCSNEDDLTTASVSDTQTDMEVLSRFIDVNEATNEYYINENKKTRALSYVSDSDWQALQNVSPVNLEKCKKDLQALNEQVAEAVSDPKVAYMVFSVNGKTIVKNLRNAKFGFEKSEGTAVSSRTIPSTLMVYGGSEQTTTPFKDPSRTIRMTVEKDPFVTGYYFSKFLVLMQRLILMTIQQLLKVLRLVELVLCLIHRLHGQLITMLWKMGSIIGNLRLKEVHQVMVQ